MENVLIYADLQRAAREKILLTSSVVFFQNLYNAFKTAGVTMTLTELNDIVSLTVVRRVGTDQQKATVEAKVKAKLVAAAGEQTYGGVKLNSQKVADMIDVPNVDLILEALKEYYAIPESNLSFRITLLELIGDTVAKVAGTDATLTALFTFYTVNDRGVVVATKLFALAALLNDWQDYQPNKQIAPYSSDGVKIVGMEFYNNAYRPSLEFIRNQEASHPA